MRRREPPRECRWRLLCAGHRPAFHRVRAPSSTGYIGVPVRNTILVYQSKYRCSQSISGAAVSHLNEDSAYDRLRAAILSLEFVPGERLSERGLESVLGASRTPIRAALMRLENEGLTQRARPRLAGLADRPGRGARGDGVPRGARGRGGHPRGRARRPTRNSRRCARSPSVHRDRDDEETGLRDGSDFHVALARLSRNPFLADGMAGALTRLSRTRWLEVRTPQSRAQARDEHSASSPRSGPRRRARPSALRGGAQPRHPRPAARLPQPRSAAGCAGEASRSSSPRHRRRGWPVKPGASRLTAPSPVHGPEARGHRGDALGEIVDSV